MALWTPADLPDLALWFDPTDNSKITLGTGGLVRSIDDQGGNAAKRFNSVTASLGPSFTTVNGNQALLFDGNGSDYLAEQSSSGLESIPNGPNTYIAAAGNLSTSGVQGVLSTANATGSSPTNRLYGAVRNTGGSGVWLFRHGGTTVNSSSTATDAIVIQRRSGTSILGYVNGAQVASSSTGANFTSGTSCHRVGQVIGANVPNGWVGDIIVCSSALGTDDRQKAEGYLAHKWGLAGSLPGDHPYKSAPPETGGGGDVEIVPADAGHSHGADAVTISAKSDVAPNDATSGHLADQLAIANLVVPADATSAISADQLAVAPVASLVPAEAAHVQTADVVMVSAASSIAPAEADHSQTAVQVEVGFTPLIGVASARSAQSADAAAVVFTPLISVSGARSPHTAEPVTVASGGAVVPTSGLHSQSAETVALNAASTIAPAEATQAVASDSPSIAPGAILIAADTTQAVTSDEAGLAPVNAVSPDDAGHVSSADAVGLSVNAVVVIQDTRHLQAAEAPSIGVRVAIVANDIAHATRAGSPTIAAAAVLVVAPAEHTQRATSPSIATHIPIAANDALHAVRTGSPLVFPSVDFDAADPAPGFGGSGPAPFAGQRPNPFRAPGAHRFGG